MRVQSNQLETTILSYDEDFEGKGGAASGEWLIIGDDELLLPNDDLTSLIEIPCRKSSLELDPEPLVILLVKIELLREESGERGTEIVGFCEEGDEAGSAWRVVLARTRFCFVGSEGKVETKRPRSLSSSGVRLTMGLFCFFAKCSSLESASSLIASTLWLLDKIVLCK